MKLRFPLKDVNITLVNSIPEITDSLYSDAFTRINQSEFTLKVDGVADYYAHLGKEVRYSIYPGATKENIELYLNGSVYGAILHQRKIIPLHGSCFNYHGLGMMICGDSGAGKSSLTASFWQDGARFLTDDVTPLMFKNDRAYIWNMSDRIKLWNDTLMQLGHKNTGLKRVTPETDKYYFPIDKDKEELSTLDCIYIIEIRNDDDINFEELNGPEKFGALRGEIYRPEYLKGMPENEKLYFQQLINISNGLRVIKVIRPEKIKVQHLMDELQAHSSSVK